MGLRLTLGDWDSQVEGDFTILSNEALMAILLGEDSGSEIRERSRSGNGVMRVNRRPMASSFPKANPTVGMLVDSWGNPFRVVVDGNGDGSVADPSVPESVVAEEFIVYSAGPDGDFSTWGDNITTWKDGVAFGIQSSHPDDGQ